MLTFIPKHFLHWISKFASLGQVTFKLGTETLKCFLVLSLVNTACSVHNQKYTKHQLSHLWRWNVNWTHQIQQSTIHNQFLRFLIHSRKQKKPNSQLASIQTTKPSLAVSGSTKSHCQQLHEKRHRTTCSCRKSIIPGTTSLSSAKSKIQFRTELDMKLTSCVFVNLRSEKSHWKVQTSLWLHQLTWALPISPGDKMCNKTNLPKISDCSLFCDTSNNCFCFGCDCWCQNWCVLRLDVAFNLHAQENCKVP